MLLADHGDVAAHLVLILIFLIDLWTLKVKKETQVVCASAQQEKNLMTCHVCSTRRNAPYFRHIFLLEPWVKVFETVKTENSLKTRNHPYF